MYTYVYIWCVLYIYIWPPLKKAKKDTKNIREMDLKNIIIKSIKISMLTERGWLQKAWLGCLGGTLRVGSSGKWRWLGANIWKAPWFLALSRLSVRDHLSQKLVSGGTYYWYSPLILRDMVVVGDHGGWREGGGCLSGVREVNSSISISSSVSDEWQI